MTRPALMLLGTASSVGKSLLAAGLCRLLRRNGVDVAPFKAQNMSNNAAACADGGEIGRAQAFQAWACDLEPEVDMNPVLIKPEGDRRAQLIVSGRARGILHASRFREDREGLLDEALAAFERIAKAHEFVVVEGAGSAAEPNLREGDLVNLGFAAAADLEAWLVGDIDRGGVFASLLGTMHALDAADRRRIEGFVINRFRGERALLGDAVEWLEARTERPVFGVVPLLPGLRLPDEDAPYQALQWGRSSAAPIRVAVVHPPTASNLTDLDALSLVPSLSVELVDEAARLEGADLVILPGSKSVFRDLRWIRERGFPDAIARHLRYGGRVLGICGGLQMLGSAIEDPHGVEGGGREEGLGWLPIVTRLAEDKHVAPVSGEAAWPAPLPCRGYEIHHGVTTLEDGRDTAPERWPLHAISDDGRVCGTYLHGIFDEAPYRDAVLSTWFGASTGAGGPGLEARWREDLERLADALAQHLDLSSLEARVGRKLRS